MAENRVAQLKREPVNLEKRSLELLCKNFIKLPNLKYLNLTQCGIRYYNYLMIANVKYLTSLEEFVLSNHFHVTNLKMLENILAQMERSRENDYVITESRDKPYEIQMLKKLFLGSPSMAEIPFDDEFKYTEQLRVNLASFSIDKTVAFDAFFDKFKNICQKRRELALSVTAAT